MALNDIFCVPLKLRLEDTIARQYKTKKITLLFCSRLFVPLTSSKVLALDKKNKQVSFVLFSLIRTFAGDLKSQNMFY